MKDRTRVAALLAVAVVLFSELPWGGDPALAADACGQAGLAVTVTVTLVATATVR